jgi:hypothetical protein
MTAVESISDGKSKLLGQGEWVKDSCYQVHEVEGKFYAIIVSGYRDMWLMDETLQEIKEEEISQYI